MPVDEQVVEDMEGTPGLDRRATVKGMAAATAVAAMGASGAQAAPSRGGHLAFGIGAGSTTDSLDPGHAEQSFTQILLHAYNSYLVEITPAGNVRGELAEFWEPSAAADSWTFRLRKGVEFHNGKTVDARDVVASLNHHRGEDATSAGATILSAVTDVRADGNDTVVIDLAGGNSDFPVQLSQYTFPIQPDADGRIDWRSGIGCGGYVLREFEPGLRAALERHPNFWKSGRAWFDSVEMLTIADVAARTNALLSGSIDLMDRCDTRTIGHLEDNDTVRVKRVTGSQHYVYPMRTDTAPFTDNNVRLALKHALDREKFVELVLNGYGSPGNDHPIAPTNRFYARDLPQRTYDPDKARFHLKEAGLTDLDVNLSVSDAAFAGCIDGAVLYAETAAAADAGIAIDVERVPADGYWAHTWMQKAWAASYWGGRPSEDWMFTMAYARDAAWNETFWDHPHFENLLVSARSELDENRRRDMYVEMQTIMCNEGGAVIPCFSDYVFAAGRDLGHDAIAGNFDMDGFRILERWWKA